MRSSPKLNRPNYSVSRIQQLSLPPEHLAVVTSHQSWRNFTGYSYTTGSRILVHTYDAPNEHPPLSTSKTSCMHTDQVEIRFKNSLTLVTPRIRTTYAKGCFNYATPSLWNEHPSNIREARTISTFKKLLKTLLSSPLWQLINIKALNLSNFILHVKHFWTCDTILWKECYISVV